MKKRKCVYLWSTAGPFRKSLMDSLKTGLSPSEVSIIDGEKLVIGYDAHPANKCAGDDQSSSYSPRSRQDTETFFLHLRHMREKVIMPELEQGKHVVVSLEFWQYWPAWAVTKDLVEMWNGMLKDIEDFDPDLNMLLLPSVLELEALSLKDRLIFNALLGIHNLSMAQGSNNFFILPPFFREFGEMLLPQLLKQFFAFDGHPLQP
jgi:hypothetical protein